MMNDVILVLILNKASKRLENFTCFLPSLSAVAQRTKSKKSALVVCSSQFAVTTLYVGVFTLVSYVDLFNWCEVAMHFSKADGAGPDSVRLKETDRESWLSIKTNLKEKVAIVKSNLWIFFSPIQPEVSIQKRKWKKRKTRPSIDQDSGYTTHRFIDHPPSPRPLSDSDCTTPQFFSVDESGLEATNAMLSTKPEGEHEVFF